MNTGNSVSDSLGAALLDEDSLVITCKVSNLCQWLLKHVSTETEANVKLPPQTIMPSYTEAWVAARDKASVAENTGTIQWYLITEEDVFLTISIEWFISKQQKLSNALRVCIDTTCDKRDYEEEEHEHNCVCSSGVCIEASMGTTEKTWVYAYLTPVSYDDYALPVKGQISEFNHNNSVLCENIPDGSALSGANQPSFKNLLSTLTFCIAMKSFLFLM